jgi:hypothetical protein
VEFEVPKSIPQCRIRASCSFGKRLAYTSRGGL